MSGRQYLSGHKTQLPNFRSLSITPPLVLVINVLPKIWRPKAKNNYIPTATSNDIDDSIFLFEKLGHCVVKADSKTWQDNDRDDLITYLSDPKDKAEFEDNFKIGPDVPTAVKATIESLVKKYWDCFCGRGARRPIIGYEFSIDTGQSKPVCKYASVSCC